MTQRESAARSPKERKEGRVDDRAIAFITIAILMTPRLLFAVGSTNQRVKLFRNLPFLLLVLFTLLAVITGASFVPEVQTAAAQIALGGKEGLHGTVGTFSAAFGKVEVTDLHLENQGAVLTLPALSARLPLAVAALRRKVSVQSVVAKGWTLDLSHYTSKEPARLIIAPLPESEGETPSSSATPPVNLQIVGYVFQGLLSQIKLPCDLALDGVEVDGDVLMVLVKGQKPTRFHLSLKGGGIANGREGSLDVTAMAAFLDIGALPMELNAQGSLTVAMDSPRTVQRFAVKTAFSAKGGELPEPLAFTTDFAAARAPAEETYNLDLSRDTRHLATVLAHFPDATHRLTGTWKTDLRDADLAPFVDHRPLPGLAATGEGNIDSDASFVRIHAAGHINVVGSRLGVVDPALAPLGTATLETRFNATHSGKSLHFDQLNVTLAGDHPAVVAQSLQAFDLDEKTEGLTLADAKKDWLEGSIDGFPLTWLSGVMGGFNLVGGNTAGAFTVKASDGNFTLRPKAPFTLSDVALQRGGKTLAQKLDLSLALLVDIAPKGWQLQLTPLAVSSAGHALGNADLKVSRSPEKEHPVLLTGKWSADLETLRTQAEIPALPWSGAQTASGDLSVTVGAKTTLDSKFVVATKEAEHSVSVNLHTDFTGDRPVSFKVPIKVSMGANVSELSVEGQWGRHETFDRIDVIVTGKNVALEHLRLLASPFASIGGVSLNDGSTLLPNAEQPKSAAMHDRTPFWGDAMGRLMIAFDQLKAGDAAFETVRGTFELDHGSIKLKSGVYGPPDKILGDVEGSVTFDPVAPMPYRLQAKMADHEVDAAPLFGTPPKGQDAAFKGKFIVSSSLKGEGANLDDLISRTQQEFQLKSSSGIIRMLKTDVNEALPDTSTVAGDAVGEAGSLVGKFFGVQHEAIRPNETHLAKNTEATLQFIGEITEIGYDELTITATRGMDRVIHVENITVVTPDEDATGSGEIAYTKGLSLGAQALSFNLTFGARDRIAGIATTAGLLSTEKDSRGYTTFKQSVHFGGTLEHLDSTGWHNLLVEAAKRKPEPDKKGAPPATAKK